MKLQKNVYVQPKVNVIEIDSRCMLGNESGQGTGASLDVEFSDDFEKEHSEKNFE